MFQEQCRSCEIKIVDYILGNLPPDSSRALEDHMADCPFCSNLCHQWRELLKAKGDCRPPEHLYQRLKKSFLRRKLKLKLLQPAFLWALMSVAVIVVMVTGLSAIKGQYRQEWAVGSHFKPDDIPSGMLNDSRTVQYEIEPLGNHLRDVSGNIWVNSYRDEIYFCIQGLRQAAGYEYQVWLIKPVSREKGGKLNMTEDYARLYLQGRNVRQVQQISISREPPKGGSIFASGEVILLDLSRVINQY